ncbi:MAG: hypothetical protein ACRCZF_10950, partial [Gemmataceae bacterium]
NPSTPERVAMHRFGIVAWASLLAAILAGMPTGAFGQEPVKLAETLTPGTRYQVELKVEIDGRLAIPATDKQPARVVNVVGKSLLIYDERILPPDELQAKKVIRNYRDVQLERTTDGVRQTTDLRPSVRRLVVHRSDQAAKAAFSPEGPLTWNELDLIRTDIFSPVLVPGLLIGTAVKPGDQWQMSPAAVRDLTDLEKVDAGLFTTKFAAVVKVNNRDHAKLILAGSVKGVDDLGPGEHRIDGTAYYDLTANFLSYVSFKASHDLLDKTGKVVGRIDGRFTLSRKQGSDEKSLSDESLQQLDTKPGVENTQLLYDNPELGLRFVYPRRWRVGTVQGRQLTVDGPNAGGLLLTLESSEKVPTIEAYRDEAVAFLKRQKATVGTLDAPQRLAEKPNQLDRAGFDVDLDGEKLRMEYAVLNQLDGGVVAAARLPRADATLKADFERILKKLTLTKKVPPRP